MRSNAGMANRQEDVDLRFAQVEVPQVNTLAWPGLAWLGRQSHFIHLPMKMEQIEYSETSANKIETPGNYPKENILCMYVSACMFVCMYIHMYVYMYACIYV